MDKLQKTFQQGQVLNASELNLLTSKIDELVNFANASDPSLYLPLTAGSAKKLTGDLYLDGGHDLKLIVSSHTAEIHQSTDGQMQFTADGGFAFGGSLFPVGTRALGNAESQWNRVYASNFYEGGNPLSAKYLGINATAADSDKLDGHDSSYFALASHTHSQYLTTAVTSFFGKTGAITCVQNSTTNGAVNFDMSAGGQLSATVHGGYNAGNCNNASTAWTASTLTATTIYENGTALSDKYAALSHTHSQYLTSAVTSLGGKTGAITLGTGLDIEGSGKLYVKLGTSSTDACAGNDSRLSDSRTPLAHASSATTYGIGTASDYGHMKLGAANQNGATAEDGVCAPNGHIHSQYLSASGTSNSVIPLLAYNNAASSALAKLSYNPTTGAFYIQNGNFGVGGSTAHKFYVNGSCYLGGAVSGITSLIVKGAITANGTLSGVTTLTTSGKITGGGDLQINGALTGVTSIDSLLSFDTGEVTVNGNLFANNIVVKGSGTAGDAWLVNDNGMLEIDHVDGNGSLILEHLYPGNGGTSVEMHGTYYGQHVRPSSDGTYSLGDNAHQWKDLYLSGVLNANGNDLYIYGDVWACDEDQIDTYGMHAAQFYTLSDERKKNIIVERYLSLSEINSLRSVKFNFLGKSENKAGTIAQDVLKVLPEVVTEDSNGFYSLDYGALATVIALSLGKVSQSQEERIAALEAQIAMIKGNSTLLR